MRLLIFGASGTIGRAIVAEALRRGHDVTGVARSRDGLARLEGAIRRVPLDLDAEPTRAEELVLECDAVVSALRPPTGRERALVSLTLGVVEAAGRAATPTFVVGGAANLRLSPADEQTVLTTPGFLPEGVRPIAEACAAQEAALAALGASHWTCLRPAPELFQGERTGRYAFGTDVAVRDDEGRSRISHADFACAMTDLVESAPAPDRFLTAGWTGRDPGADRRPEACSDG